ncbi:lamin tail domain-containing protein [Haloarchaeobius amylolyticus]|uniref:lamin tail domain-containing protein n=1 Tax=Haloarchaeobius amylolyticus TaxID=1198296 RepID=UPI0022707917|nr:lamin tail domain-containing protein [Haloarchaeobius amylolyticus]
MSHPEKVHHSPLAVDEIRNDPVGRDVKHLDEEYVRFENTGDDPLDISGWTVENDAGERYEFPEGTVLEPGFHLTLHTGSGADTETDHYWGSEKPVWNNLEDSVFVRDDTGTLRIRETYNK